MHRGSRIAIAIALVVITGACGWTQARSDAARTASNPFETSIGVGNVGRLEQEWFTRFNPFLTEPVVQDGWLVGQTWMNVEVYNASTGAPRWSAPLTPLTDATVTSAKGVGTAHAADGSAVVLSADAIHGRIGYPQGSGGQLAAYSVDTGALLWSQPIGPTGPPLVIDQTVYQLSVVSGFGPSFAGLVALDVTTGAVKFRVAGAFSSSLAAAGGFVLAGSEEGFQAIPAAGCGAATCSASWSGQSGRGTGNFTQAVAASSSTVFTATYEGVDAYPAGGCGQPTCAPLWHAAGGASGLAVTEATIFVDDPWGNDATLRAYASAGCGAPTCAPLWTTNQVGRYSAPAVANGVVYAGDASGNGALRAWNAAGCGTPTCEPLLGIVTSSPVSVSPVVWSGRVYVNSFSVIAFAPPHA